jgi:hypothetical protein
MTLDPEGQKIVDTIAKQGWFETHVLEDAQGPGFSVSTGLWETLSAPELIMFGLPDESCHAMLWEVFDRLRGGLTLTDGLRVGGLIDDYDCVLRSVHVSQLNDYFSFALWYRHLKLGSSDGLQALQLFWPSAKTGLFPWDPGCSDSVRDSQPLLYLPLVRGQHDALNP